MTVYLVIYLPKKRGYTPYMYVDLVNPINNRSFKARCSQLIIYCSTDMRMYLVVHGIIEVKPHHIK